MTNAATEPVSVPARPAPFSLDPARTAVIVVDMQNDFVAPGGMFDAAGIDISGGRATIEPIRRTLAAGRAAGVAVVYLRMEFRADFSDLGAADSPNAIKHRFLGVGPRDDGAPTSSMLVRGTWNTAIVDELAPEAGDIVVSKQRFSGFYNTELDTILRGRGVRSLILTGVTTSICVDSTLRDAAFRDYQCLLLEDCCAEPIGANAARSNHDATLLTTELLFGWVSDSASLLSAIGTTTATSAAR